MPKAGEQCINCLEIVREVDEDFSDASSRQNKSRKVLRCGCAVEPVTRSDGDGN